MSTSLIEQLEDYFDQVEARQSPVTAEEVEARRISVTAIRPATVRNQRGLLVAAIAAILVLLVGIIPLLFTGEKTPPANTVDTTPTSTPSPPTTNAPATTLPVEGFAPSLEGSGVDVTFDVTPMEMTIAGNDFVLMEADWSIDWESVAWEWGDDEIRQRIAASYRGNNTLWSPPDTLVFVDNADKGGEGSFARFTLSFSGTSGDFEIQAHEASTGDYLATVTGSLPGLDKDQILERLVSPSFAPARAAWFFSSDDGELTPLDPPWQPFYGSQFADNNRFFETGPFTLALFKTNLWRTTDGYDWEDLGLPPWDPNSWFEIDVVGDEFVVNAGYSYWTTIDGVDWVELSESEYESKTGTVIVGDENAPEPPDPSFPEDLDRAAIEAHFDELAQNAVVVSEDPLILQLLPGPEPRFDTSALGDEIPFEPLSGGDRRVDWLVQMIAEGAGAPGPQPDGPVLFVGHVTDETMALPHTDMDRLADWRMLWASGCSFECLGVGGLQEAGELSGDIWTDRNPGLLIAVPLDTAVVAVRYNAEAALWQRPTGGWAIFPLSVDGDDTYWIDAYDAGGKLIATTEKL